MNIDTSLYLTYIRKALEDRIRTADIMNKMALEMKTITVTQYSEAARLIADAFLKTI